MTFLALSSSPVEPLLVLLQSGDLSVPGIDGLTARRSGQGLFGSPVALAAPLGEEGGVEALPTEERSLLGLAQRVVLGQDPRLVGRGEPAWPSGSFGDLGVRVSGVVHRTSMLARAVRVG